MTENDRIPVIAGAVQYLDRAKLTTLSTGTTRTQIHRAIALVVPADAREIVGFCFDHSHITHASEGSDQVQIKVDVVSEDFVIQPFEVTLTGQVGGIGTISDQHSPTPEVYLCHVPVVGGEEFKIFGTSKHACATGIYLGATIYYSNKRSGRRQIFRKTGTTTATPTTSGEGAGTAYNIYGADEIIEVKASLCLDGASLGTSEPLIGYCRITSPDFEEPTPLEFCGTPHPAGLGTIGTPTHGQDVRFKVRVPVKRTCTLQDYFNLENDITDASKWTTDVAFYKIGK